MTKKTKQSNKNKRSFGEGFSIVASVFLFVLLLKNARFVSAETANALKRCATLLIPSLFPLTVAAELITASGALEKITSRFKRTLSKLLGISRNASSPYLLGILGGYTSSCKSAIMLFENEQISAEDCESIIAISNMPSLAFLTSFVGAEILQSNVDGWILWMITVFSTLLLGIINSSHNRRASKPLISVHNFQSVKRRKKLSKLIVEAISHSAQAMLVICACVVFFSVLIKVLELALISFGVPTDLLRLFLGALEITYGVASCAQIENELVKRVICAFFIGWSGLCVHFQVISLCEKINFSFKRYFLLKFLQGLICALLSLLVFSCK